MMVRLNQPKFGNASPLTRMFHLFENRYEPGFLVLSKFMANSAPRLAFTRNKNERQEVLFNELVQGSALFVLLPITAPIGDFVQGKLAGIPRQWLKMRNADALAQAGRWGGERLQNSLKVAKLGKSLGASAFIAAMLVATTYLRNYRTIQRTGFSDYQKVVGLGGNVQPTAEDRVKAEAAMRKNMNIIKGLFAGGALAWLSVMGGAGWLVRRGKNLLGTGGKISTARLDHLMKHAAFVGKNSNQVNGPFRSQWQTLLVWGLPSYLGWFLGCRDKYEVVEQASKFLTFLGGYFWSPRVVNAVISRRYADLLKQAAPYGEMTYTNVLNKIRPENPVLAEQLVRLKNRQWGMLTGLNFVVAGALPVLFNIMFSRWRYQRSQAAAGQAPIASAPVNGLGPGIQRRPLAQWGRVPG